MKQVLIIYIHSVHRLEGETWKHFAPSLFLTFKTHNSSPNTNDLYIRVQSFQNCCNRGGNTIYSTWIMIPSLLSQFGSAFFSSKEGGVYTFVHIMNAQVIGVWGWVFGSFKVTPEVFSCVSADQSSSSTLTESSFLFDSCLIHRDTVMLE